MPALQTLAIADRQATPVTHTFSPRGRNGQVGMLARYNGIPNGEETISISMRPAPNNKFKGKMVLTVPVVQTETINGVANPVVVRRAIATVEVVYDAKSTEMERNDLIGLISSSLTPGKVLVNDAFIKCESITG